MKKNLVVVGYGGQGGGSTIQPIVIDSARGGGCGCSPCATQADVRAAVDQQTLISKLDQQTYGLADSTYALNNTIVNPGETFSFCDTVGPSTVERGYKIANVIIQGTETKGLGGGNCQVSSTLYNAVLAIPNELEVVERHPHSAPVADARGHV